MNKHKFLQPQPPSSPCIHCPFHTHKSPMLLHPKANFCYHEGFPQTNGTRNHQTFRASTQRLLPMLHSSAPVSTSSFKHFSSDGSNKLFCWQMSKENHLLGYWTLHEWLQSPEHPYNLQDQHTPSLLTILPELKNTLSNINSVLMLELEVTIINICSQHMAQRFGFCFVNRLYYTLHFHILLHIVFLTNIFYPMH